MTTRAELEAEWGDVLNPDGVIQHPGKFEGEPLYAVAFYDEMMEGGSSETLYIDEEPVDVFILSREDIREWPELDGMYAIGIWEDDNGFVYVEHFDTEQEFDAYKAREVGAEEDY